MYDPLGSVRDELARQLTPGTRVFFEPLKGNNGDKLIEMGSHAVLDSLGARLVKSPADADLIVVNGGAGLTDIWIHGLRTLQEHSRRFPAVPLVVLPSSFYFDKTDFPSLLAGRSAPVYLYARERYSLDLIEGMRERFTCDVRLGLDDDMAFHLRDTPLVDDLKAKYGAARNHVLVVERGDSESVAGPIFHGKPGLVGRVLPAGVKRVLRERVVRPIKRQAFLWHGIKAAARTPLAKQLLDRALFEDPSLRGLPVYAADISLPWLYSFDQFARLVAQAAAVVTTRLHVGILAALLGKPTWIKPGTFHKIRGIYEYSMADMDHVRLV